MPPRMLERSVLKGYTSFREIESDDTELWSAALPELARFFGIIIRMYVEPGVPHHVPHFHVYYQNHAAVYSIDPVERISGELPRRQQRLVEAWAELHQGELRESWERLQAGQAPHKIAPLH
jgi:Ser/Thr protein kinase RdoA (MazF antagonist)